MQLLRGMRLPRLCQRKPLPAQWGPVADFTGDMVGEVCPPQEEPPKDALALSLPSANDVGEEEKKGNEAQQNLTFSGSGTIVKTIMASNPAKQ